jgi:hypothetical protein
MRTDIAEPAVQEPSADPFEMLIKEARERQQHHRRRSWAAVLTLIILIAAVALAAAGGGRSPSRGSTLNSRTSSALGAPPLKSGTIVGTLKLIGGPPPGESIPARGTVIFTPFKNDPAKTVDTAANASGRFSLRLPAGSWTVTASSPQFNHSEPGACGAQHRITVKVGKKTDVVVLCEVP